MRKTLPLFFLFLLLFEFSYSQINQWAWMSGDAAANQRGSYGTKGVSTASNKPGSRYGSATWVDASGNLWLFGGIGFSDPMEPAGGLNDLWKFDLSTNQWAWMGGDNMPDQPGNYGTKGIAALTNLPPARHQVVTWTDATGNFWLFGGTTNTGHALNDLWKFDLSTNQWAWMGGDNVLDQPGIYGIKGVADPANKPGARSGAVSWTDLSGNFWLFGGAINGGRLNDLWKFDHSSGLWTWVSGDDTPNQPGNFGTKSVASSTNKPYGRAYANSWHDLSGNLWLFGGSRETNQYYYNDLWKYDIAADQWTWIGGDQSLDESAVNGTIGVADPANKPAGLNRGTTWTDASGKLWLFGGLTKGGNLLGDLWSFDPSISQWTRVVGSSFNSAGVYGTKGTADASNKPGARYFRSSWTTGSGFWLFGGSGFSSAGEGYLNDLWKYTIASATLPIRLSNFRAKKQGNHVVLNWHSGDERDGAKFIIERSFGFQYFEAIGSQAGQNSSSNSYSYTDYLPLNGKNFYRIKSVDHEGKSSFSKIEKVDFEKQIIQLTLLQNPVTNYVNLSIQTSKAQASTITVYNTAGQVLMTNSLMLPNGVMQYRLPIPKLVRGTYLIHINSKEGQALSMFIKN